MKIAVEQEESWQEGLYCQLFGVHSKVRIVAIYRHQKVYVGEEKLTSGNIKETCLFFRVTENNVNKRTLRTYLDFRNR